MEGKTDPEIPKNDNHSVPVMTVGAVSGSSGVSATDFAMLMQANKKHKGMNKSHNHKEAKKANIRRNEKNEREFQKEYNAKMQEQMEQERIEWAPKDKEDAKFQEKLAAKMQDKGPSRKEINQRILEEEEQKSAKPNKDKKNGWGKKK